MKHFSNQPLEQLEPNYLAQYGLSIAPFAQDIDDQFIFLDADRVQRLNMLHHLTQYSDLLLIVTGEQGIGKTSLLSRFEKMADDDWRICNIDANALMASDQLLRQIFSGFDFESQHSASGDIQQLFLENVSELKHTGVIPILVIDDAHELPIETLETLFELADTKLHDQRLLRIILFSDPSIDVTLKSSKISHLRERVTHTMELAPFTEEQTEQYIYHRLTVAGLQGNNPIDQKILRRIYRGSDGYPDKINKLTHIALQDGVDDVNNDALFSELNYHFPTRKYLIFGSIAAIVIGVILTIQSSINDLFDDSEQIVLNLPIENRVINSESNATPKIIPQIIVEKEIIPPKKTETTIAAKEETQGTKKPPEPAISVTAQERNLEERIILLDKELKSSTETTKTNDNDQDDMDTTVVSSKPIVSPAPVKLQTKTPEKPSSKPVIIAPTLAEINPKTIYASDKAQKISLIGSGFSERSYVTVNWSGNSKRLSSQQIKIVNNKLIEVSLTTGLKPEKWSITITHPKNGKSNSKSFIVTQTDFQKQNTRLTTINNEQWILSQDKNLFTLQLLGVKNKADITNFANQKKLSGQYAMFSSIRNGEIWYHLIYGSYKNKLSALKSIKAIPKKIGIGKPWIRPMLDVQNAVKRYKESRAVTKIKPALDNVSPIQSAASVPKTIKEQSSWLWGQSPTHYTLQLLGTRTESSVKKFVLLHKLQGKAIYFNVKRQGKDWYSLVYGVYPDKNSAIKARTTLSKRLQKAKPWPRNFASIHAELDKNP